MSREVFHYRIQWSVIAPYGPLPSPKAIFALVIRQLVCGSIGASVGLLGVPGHNRKAAPRTFRLLLVFQYNGCRTPFGLRLRLEPPTITGPGPNPCSATVETTAVDGDRVRVNIALRTNSLQEPRCDHQALHLLLSHAHAQGQTQHIAYH